MVVVWASWLLPRRRYRRCCDGGCGQSIPIVVIRECPRRRLFHHVGVCDVYYYQHHCHEVDHGLMYCLIRRGAILHESRSLR
jgi:hypothetical protein